MTELPRRALNRATLARQLLLERADLPVPAAVAHLVGLQAQTTHTWYVGLWTRLAGLDPVAVGALLESRELVRLPVMRSTIHLLTAADALALRPLTQAPIERSTMGQFGRRLNGVVREELVAAARALVEERPLIASELGRSLAERFPAADPTALAQAARAWLPMVQVPPRGVWGRGGRAMQAPLDSWLGRPPTVLAVRDLVTRYLAAFGPASVRDVQTWSGLTRLADVLDELRPTLRSYTGEDGAELFDLPDAPRPDPDTPTPARFLYDYDNLLLSHADRRRMFGNPGDTDYAAHGFTGDGNLQPASVLVNGFVAATWTVARERGHARLTVRCFRKLTRAERTEVTREGAALLAFLHPVDDHDVWIG
ncbi:MAG TPA: winged helix DNA-binding domain-containing protein [Actinophytocola sp.]|nr:winged helix DNA-binding domain-containing protein [Actinophytocola sp.]